MAKISQELKDLVFYSVALLGQQIKQAYGADCFHQVEQIRQTMKKHRADNADKLSQALNKIYKDFSLKSNEQLHQITKSFSLMLELINRCESAYRAHKLRGLRVKSQGNTLPESTIYVFTSHPTEARSESFLHVMDKVQSLLERALEGMEFTNKSTEPTAGVLADISDELAHYLGIALRIRIANSKKPTVLDEISQVFYTVLKKDVVLEQIQLKQKGVSVYFRTWVGGDKDGHPGVDEKSMLASWSYSRKKILDIFLEMIDYARYDLDFIKKNDTKSNLKQQYQYLDQLKSQLKKMRKVSDKDGNKVRKVYNLMESLAKKDPSFWTKQMQSLLEIYPALVLPLELREDSEVIGLALEASASRSKEFSIIRMLKRLKAVSQGANPKNYARGFILSMCQEPINLIHATELVKKYVNFTIPVVPLFENEKGLVRATSILTIANKKLKIFEHHKKHWSGKFEVMVGYSDSSKENGVLAGRTMVESAVDELDLFLQEARLTPIFFHGSGGSISRGGGSVEEQISWWPLSALNNSKVTIQGEAIQRNFHHRRFLRSQLEKIVRAYDLKNHEGYLSSGKKHLRDKDFDLFVRSTKLHYRELVNSPVFQTLVEKVTPYQYLNVLKIGSRPTKRNKTGTFSLRAIPWILCWTQIRLLLPVWWGVGSAWCDLSRKQQTKIASLFHSSPMLSSYLKQLGFTLSKVELGVWDFLLQNSNLAEEQKDYWKEEIHNEMDKVRLFISDVSEQDSLTWYRPMLGESIYLRSSMIHPLNVIQKIAIERADSYLLRETVTGIACGMLTTG